MLARGILEFYQLRQVVQDEVKSAVPNSSRQRVFSLGDEVDPLRLRSSLSVLEST